MAATIGLEAENYFGKTSPILKLDVFDLKDRIKT